MKLEHFSGMKVKPVESKICFFDSFVNSYNTVLPSDKILDLFYAFMDTIQTKKQTVLAENQHLSSLRDWLLPMLMNGQVTVGGNEKSLYKEQDGFRMAAEPEK